MAPTASLESHADAAGVASPEMTILEAADVMERLHDSKLLVERAGRPIGFLTEHDIIEYVLARGSRPEEVTVWEAMRRSWDDQGADARPDWFESFPFLASAQIYQGKCEECDVFSIELAEREGLLLCADCRETRLPADRA